MKKQIYDEKNGMSYTLHGDYYLPDLVLREEEPTYGKYGMLRKQFLKEYRPIRYQNLLLSGKLTAHLNHNGSFLNPVKQYQQLPAVQFHRTK